MKNKDPLSKEGTNSSIFPNDAGYKYLTKNNTNLNTETIIITEDKLRLILRDYKDNTEYSEKWKLPISLSFSLAITLLTASFKGFWFFTADFIFAMFAVALIVSLAFSIIWGIKAFKRRRIIGIDCLINQIKAKDEKTLCLKEEEINGKQSNTFFTARHNRSGDK